MPTKIIIARDHRDGKQFMDAQKSVAHRLGLPVPAFEIIHDPRHARGRLFDLEHVIFTPRFAADSASAEKIMELAPTFIHSWNATQDKKKRGSNA